MNAIYYTEKKSINMITTTFILAVTGFVMLQSDSGHILTDNEWGFAQYVLGGLVSLLIAILYWGVKTMVQSLKDNTAAIISNTNLLTRHSEAIKNHDEKLEGMADDIHEIKQTLTEHEKRLPK